jgi:serine/threonine protein phosphatase PrpC
MKLQWYGAGHQSRQAAHRYDHFGLCNFHRLKFRTTQLNSVSRGETRSLPTLAVMSSGVSSAPEPAFAARVVVRDLLNDFRHNGRAQILETDELGKWLRFKVEDLHQHMLNLSEENRQLTGFSASFTALILLDRRILLAQIGDTMLFHLRKRQVLTLSNGERTDATPPTDASHGHKLQAIGFRNLASSELTPLISSMEVRRNDLLCMCTRGVSQIFTPEKLIETTRNTRSLGDIESTVQRMNLRASELRPNESIATLMLRVR